MGVEREVGGVDGEVGGEGNLEAFALGADEGTGAVPEQPVVDEEEIDTGGGGGAKGMQAGVDGGADAGDGAVVLELEAVVGAGEVGEAGEAEALVARRAWAG